MPGAQDAPHSAGGRLYLQVLVAIAAGAAFGHFDPAHAVKLKPLGDGFIALVKMLIGPIVFCTVVQGIAGSGDMRRVGRVGARALVYFEVVSTVALAIGLGVMHWLKPGANFHVDPASLDSQAVARYAQAAAEQSTTDFLLHIVPRTLVDAFTANGDLLQVLLLALLFGAALLKLGAAGERLQRFIAAAAQALFGMMNIVMKLAPLGAAGAMAFTVGNYGLGALKPLAALMGSFYLTCLVFVLGVLGAIAACTGFSILRYLAYIKDELLTVLGTSSSETALVPLMDKLERLGCDRAVVGLVVPSGYSFNLDGTNIYLTMAALFVAQALDIDLSLREELTLLGVAMLTSKGASGVTGAGFVTLAATLAVVPAVPVAGLALILGIDRFMSEARALTNFIGNGVATVVVARWEGALDRARLREVLARP